MAAIAKVIRVKEIPEGDAPFRVRQGWLECEMPCEPECGHVPMYVTGITAKQHVGLLSTTEFLETGGPFKKVAGFSVPQDLALQVLEVHAPEAAQWFYDHGFPHEGMAFRFRNEEVEVLRTFVWDEVPNTKMRVYEDLERGTMLRVG